MKPMQIALLAASIVLLLATNAASLYFLVDARVTIGYLESSCEMQARDKRVLAAFALEALSPLSQDEIVDAAERTNSDTRHEEDALFLDQVGLEFRDGRLNRIRFSTDAP